MMISRLTSYALTAPVRLMLVFMSLSLSFLAIDPWHNWGGDYAYYLGVARNLLFDRPLETGNIGVVAPNGFPWLLSKTAPLLEWNFLSLKRVNLIWTLCYCGLIVYISNFFSSVSERLSFVALATINLGIWYYANQILTELLFLTLITSVFAILLRNEQRQTKILWTGVAVVYLIALAACTIKQAALLILFVPPFMFLDNPKSMGSVKQGLVFLALCLVSGVAAMAVYNAGWFNAATHAGLSASSSGVFGKIISMLGKADEEFSALAAMMAGDVRSIWLGVFITTVVAIAAVLRLVQRKLSVIVLLGAVILPIFYVPWSPPDGRYWFPLLGILTFLFVEGASAILSMRRARIPPEAAGILISALFAALSWHHLSAINRIYLFDRDRGVFEENASEMFYWVHYNTEWGKRVCFFKPRILGYHANWNNVCGIAQNSSPEDVENLLAGSADFIVVSDQYAPQTWTYANTLPDERIAYRNARYVVVGKRPTGI